MACYLMVLALSTYELSIPWIRDKQGLSNCLENHSIVDFFSSLPTLPDALVGLDVWFS